MMMHEFTERTGYEPSFEEYQMIEESYYDFPGDKDAFCKQWLKDKKDGHWDREYKLLKMLAEQKSRYEKQLGKQEEKLDFYRAHCQELKTKVNDLTDMVEKANGKLVKIQMLVKDA